MRSELSRRAFLKVAAIGSTGLLLSVHFAARGAADSGGAKSDLYELDPRAYVRIARDGKVHLIVPRVEMGQAVYTAVVQLVAEELDVEPAQFVVEHAPPDGALYGIPAGAQITGGSTTIRALWIPMRMVGALARKLLIEAAARSWNVAPESCRTEKGVVYHDASRRSTPYAALVDAVAERPPVHVELGGGRFFAPPPPDVALADSQTTVRLKERKDFKVIGTSLERVEGAEKVRGEALFGIDVRLPGMLVGTVMASPVFGGKLAGVDDAKARALPGVHHVVELRDAVAVLGDHFWAAKSGLDALVVRWDEGAHAALSTADLVADLARASDKPGLVARESGDAPRALERAEKRIHARYEAPMLAHATMEPPNCVVHVRKSGCDVWVGTQVPAIAQQVVAQVLGIPPASVEIHNHYLGGGFGRRLEVDFIAQAATIAKQVDVPVKIVWTREEDIQHDLYRPYYYDRLSAGLDAEGRITAWTHRIVGSSILARYAPSELSRNGVDIDAVDGALQLQYAIPNLRIEYVREEPRSVPTGWWRGVGATHNVFVIESFVDELAHAAGIDPLEFRRRALANAPRATAVLEKVAAEAHWGSALPKGSGRGVAVGRVFGSDLALAAEVSVSSSGEVRVERVVCAVDCGIAVNPAHVATQIEGGILFGLSPVLFDAVTISSGRVQQSNFHDYRVVRMPDTPKLEVHVVDSGEAPGGIGETGTALIAPAVANAVFAATGVRVRKLPITREDLLAKRASAPRPEGAIRA